MSSPLPPSSSEPFDLGNQQAPSRVLLFHGFSGSPYEVLPLAHHLVTNTGVRVVGPRLPGHGTTPARLAEATADQFMAVATQALLDLTSDGSSIVVGGLSMGGLVATCLAAAHPTRVRALVLMAPAFRLRPEGQVAVRLANWGVAPLFPIIPKGTPGGDCEDPEGRRLNPGYLVIPVGGLPALGAMQVAAAAALQGVRAPVCIVQGRRDRTVPASVARGLPKKLHRAPVAELHVLPRSRHLLPLDVERDEVFRLVETFLRRVRAVGADVRSAS